MEIFVEVGVFICYINEEKSMNKKENKFVF